MKFCDDTGAIKQYNREISDFNIAGAYLKIMPPKRNQAAPAIGGSADGSHNDVHNSHDDSALSEKLDDELKELGEEEAKLEKQLKIQDTKRRINFLKEKLQNGGSMGECGTHSQTSTEGSAGSVTLSDIRAMEGLQKEVDGVLGEEVGSSPVDNIDKGKHFKLSRSGKEAKLTDCVKVTLRWPHTALKYNMGQSQLVYSDLDFPSLVAGELEIINAPDTKESERHGRMELLKATAYHSQHFPWKDVLNFHGTCLLEVEKGERAWGGRDSFLSVEASTLYTHLHTRTTGNTFSTKGPDDTRSDGRKWFCKPFQVGKCRHNGSHDAQVQGRMRTVHHICATCLQLNGKAELHAENTAECPHNQQ